MYQNWAKLGKNPGHVYIPCHVFDPGAMSCTQMSLGQGLDVGLIEWTERLAQGSEDPQFSAKTCPSQQSTSQEDHKHTLATSVQRKAEESQREAGRPPLGWPAWSCLRFSYASYTDSRRRSQTSMQRWWPDGHIPRPAGLGEAVRPHFAASDIPASRGS